MTEAKIAQMYTALKRITLYDSPEKLRRHSEGRYGLGYDEALEYAYENVIDEARKGLRGVRLPRAKKPKAADPQPQTAPSGEGKEQS